VYTDMGRLNMAARQLREIAEAQEKQGLKEEAIAFYSQVGGVGGEQGGRAAGRTGSRADGQQGQAADCHDSCQLQHLPPRGCCIATA
jgi:hypothetical protein